MAAVPARPDSAAIDTTRFSSGALGVLRPGDELNIVVYRNKELSGKYLIDSRGYLQIPGLGIIRVAGLSPDDVTTRLREQLMRRGIVDPEIAVQPLVRISVLGEVRSPGLYSVEPGTNTLQLITLAGGPNDRSDLEEAVVVREGRQIPLNLEAALSGSEAGRLVLYSNDVLFVPRKSQLFSRENVGLMVSLAGLATSIINIYLISQR